MKVETKCVCCEKSEETWYWLAFDNNKPFLMCLQCLNETGGKNEMAVELGRKGGLKGGKATAQTLSAQQRKELALAALLARWSKNHDL